MTFVDRIIIPVYVRFLLGYSVVALAIGIIGFCMALITLLTVKGIYFPAWGIPVMFAVLVIGCVVYGWFSEHYTIQDRINSYSIRKMNPEMRALAKNLQDVKDEVTTIRQMLEKVQHD